MITLIKEIHPPFSAGEKVFLFRISNASGAYVEITNYGASIVSVVVPDRHGALSDVVLSYNSLSGYFTDTFYLGATIGRVANRISGARFILNGQTYLLDKNDGRHTNHGGNYGFDKRIFAYEISSEGLLLDLQSKDGEGGFPGNMDFSVLYSFSEDNELKITYTAKCDMPTPSNFTNHSYFNLSGARGDIRNDLLWVNAGYYLEADDEYLPTGRICPVQGGAFDFGTYRRINERMRLKQDNLRGYNAYFLKKDADDTLVASLKNEASGRVADLYTSMPGVLVYTGEFLSGEFDPFAGICLEAQYPPDAVNQPHFISNILQPGETGTDWLKYHFRVEEL